MERRVQLALQHGLQGGLGEKRVAGLRGDIARLEGAIRDAQAEYATLKERNQVRVWAVCVGCFLAQPHAGCTLHYRLSSLLSSRVCSALKAVVSVRVQQFAFVA